MIIWKDFCNDKKGFILADGIIAVVIVAIGLVAIVLAFTKSTNMSIMSSDKTKATYAAQEIVEYFKKFDGTAQQVTDALVTQEKSSGNFPSLPAGFTSVLVSTQPDASNTKLRKLNVKISWTDSVTKSIDTVELNSYYYTK